MKTIVFINDYNKRFSLPINTCVLFLHLGKNLYL